MANLFVALILISIAILIAAASADVRFTYTDSPVISVDFLFFTLEFHGSRDKGARKERKSGIFQRIRDGIRKTRARGAALDFLLRNSKLTVHSVNIPIKESEPSELVTKSGNLSALILVIFTYLSLKVEKMTLEDNTFLLVSDDTTKIEPTIDFTLKTTVYIILTALIIYLLKINERSQKKNVGNENE